ncbi:MAG: YkgJ family cysteine cluster protein [Lentisphaerae bacterium]|nr:YkgJ family cysteine cluster protein [Lentisphaerota bacterium]
MNFQCDKCGICCKLLKGIPQLAAFDRGDGVCIHLKDNLCSIYESRPDICNVEKMYVFFKEQMSEEEYLQLMSNSCKVLKQAAEDR